MLQAQYIDSPQTLDRKGVTVGRFTEKVPDPFPPRQMPPPARQAAITAMPILVLRLSVLAFLPTTLPTTFSTAPPMSRTFPKNPRQQSTPPTARGQLPRPHCQGDSPLGRPPLRTIQEQGQDLRRATLPASVNARIPGRRYAIATNASARQTKPPPETRCCCSGCRDCSCCG